MEVKTIMLFGKPLFNMVTINEPVKMATNMPENEAGFVYMLNGSCVSCSEVEEIRLTKDQAVLAKSGNSTFRTIPVNGETAYKAIIIKFHKDVLEKLYESSSSPFLTNKKALLKVNSTMVENNKLIHEYITSINTYFEQPNIPDELLQLKLKELVALLIHSDNAPDVRAIMTNLFEEKVFEFKEIIKAHISSSISIEELAQLTNRSLSSFKKYFKETYDDTPNNYLINKRIENVAELLTQSNETISNIAYDCAFKTLAHMSRVFKTKYGISPSVYRENYTDKQ